jgi:hypothetical protein
MIFLLISIPDGLLKENDNKHIVSIPMEIVDPFLLLFIRIYRF